MTTPTDHPSTLSPLAIAMVEARALLAELRTELAASRKEREAQEQLTEGAERLMKEAARLSASLTPLTKPSASQPHTTTGWTRGQGVPD